jgi:hypothetical protein
MNKIKEEKLKACLDGYNPLPFYFKQKYEQGLRYVAWTSNLPQLKQLVYDIINSFSENLEILLKISLEDNPEEFQRYYTKIRKNDLISLMKQNELYIFSDGNHQLCIKRSDTGEYMALDDHDILFIYSDSQTNTDILKNNNFENREEKLIFDSGHWHIRPKDSEKLAEKLIKELNLTLIK